MADRTYYCFCDNGCKFETLNKEQILAAITQAVNDGEIGNIDTGFITTVKTINGTPLKFFVGSQNEYELLTDAEKQNLFAVITNDTAKEDIKTEIEGLEKTVNTIAERISAGDIVAKELKNAPLYLYDLHFKIELTKLDKKTGVISSDDCGYMLINMQFAAHERRELRVGDYTNLILPYFEEGGYVRRSGVLHVTDCDHKGDGDYWFNNYYLDYKYGDNRVYVRFDGGIDDVWAGIKNGYTMEYTVTQIG